ncbi:MAG TPA: T9SS type A sorting domain-containing protein [Gemmatimonadales bacterium]|nr:T9SS type A sorting domain-containing protein [Gemmatimonadales bacterium]
MRRLVALALLLAITLGAGAVPRARAATPRPLGLYVLDNAANLNPTTQMYPSNLFSDSTYLRHVAGHAIFCPIAKIVDSVATWGQFHYHWSVLDTLVQLALTHGKSFSIELETGFESSSDTYRQALPAGFSATCGGNCAPLFDVWATGGSGGSCTSSYVLLPWVPNVQQFWSVTAESLAAHLHDIGAYGALTLVHIPGVSVYDEELRMPTGAPSPSPSDTLPCPDGRPAYPTVMSDASQQNWQTYGYSDSAVIAGFRAITSAFAQSFPDRVLGLSMFPHGSAPGIAFPNFTGDSAGYVSAQLVRAAAQIAPGRIQIQSDNLDSAVIVPSVISLARENAAFIGWQSNKHGGTGAGCGGGGANSCLPDSPSGHFYNLLAYGAAQGAHYFEIWPHDVIAYPEAVAASDAAGLYSSAAVPHVPPDAVALELAQNVPNPFGRRTTIRFALGREARVRLEVFDLAGRRVGVLVNGPEGAGEHDVGYDALGLPDGVYDYRLEANGATVTRWFVVLH